MAKQSFNVHNAFDARNNRDFYAIFESVGVPISPVARQRIEEKMHEINNYRPVIGVMGKTGVGKSSLCNALFGEDVCEVSDVEACTREQQSVTLNTGGRGIQLVDVPGVGESRERDDEYRELYRTLIPETDALFWVLKGDDRAFSTDENFYKYIVKTYIDKGKPFFVVLNQVDKIEPYREWDVSQRCPGVTQFHNIEKKRAYVANAFGLPQSQVLAVSADERYGLVELVDELIHALPNDKKHIVIDQVEEEHRSQQAKEEAWSGFVDTVVEVIGGVVGKVVDVVVDRVFGPIRSFFSLF
ncbi:MAG: GTP-binding protein [Oceanospirillaceae bacterium]|nr:GTP-binding protein [Oceanospirillaceae bacterium]